MPFFFFNFYFTLVLKTIKFIKNYLINGFYFKKTHILLKVMHKITIYVVIMNYSSSNSLTTSNCIYTKDISKAKIVCHDRYRSSISYLHQNKLKSVNVNYICK
jgi:hypothetical protein